VVLNDELRSDRRAETQRKGSCAIQFFIRERAYCGGRLMTVPTQKFERGGLRYLSMLVGEELLPLDCKPADLDQIIQPQLRVSAFPRGLELLLHKSCIVFLALGLERLLQSEQRTWVARVAF